MKTKKSSLFSLDNLQAPPLPLPGSHDGGSVRRQGVSGIRRRLHPAKPPVLTVLLATNISCHRAAHLTYSAGIPSVGVMALVEGTAQRPTNGALLNIYHSMITGNRSYHMDLIQILDFRKYSETYAP